MLEIMKISIKIYSTVLLPRILCRKFIVQQDWLVCFSIARKVRPIPYFSLPFEIFQCNISLISRYLFVRTAKSSFKECKLLDFN